jgi:hypothetical protein
LLAHLHFYSELPQFAGVQIERIGAEQSGSRGGHFHVRTVERPADKLRRRYCAVSRSGSQEAPPRAAIGLTDTLATSLYSSVCTVFLKCYESDSICIAVTRFVP